MNNLKIYLFMFLFNLKCRQNRTFLNAQFINLVTFTTNLHTMKTYKTQINQTFLNACYDKTARFQKMNLRQNATRLISTHFYKNKKNTKTINFNISIF